MVAVGGRLDVGTPIVVDGMGSSVGFSCSCLQLEPDDFSFFSLARSFAAIVINTIPTIKKINATANTTSVMIRALEYFLPKVVPGPSKIIISVLLEGSMIGNDWFTHRRCSVPCTISSKPITFQSSTATRISYKALIGRL